MALCEGIVLEEALDLSFDRLLMMMVNCTEKTNNSDAARKFRSVKGNV